MARELAMVTPEVLVWARESAGLGLQQAAERAKVRPEALAKWEAGAEWPSLVQVRKLGRVYKRPLAVFYLPKPPKGRQVLRDFRRIPNTQRQAKSPELRLEERRAHRRQSVAVELSELIGESAEPLPFRTKFGESPTDLAIAIRKALATNASRATTEAQALLAWRAAVERLGVLVFQFTGVDVEEARGFSMHANEYPVIAINARDSARARMFSLMHELAHLAIGTGGVCDLHEPRPGPVPWEDSVEAYCNAVAAEVLVPREELLNQPEVQSRYGTPPGAWTSHEVAQIASRFWVSSEVIYRRLVDLSKATRSSYHAWRSALSMPKRRKGGMASVDERVVNSTGTLYAHLVLSAYRQRRINPADVSDYLNVRLKHVPAIGILVAQRSAP